MSETKPRRAHAGSRRGRARLGLALAAGMALAAITPVAAACGDDGVGRSPSPTPSSEIVAATPTMSPTSTETPAATATPADGQARALRRGDPSRKLVALTFDAGSDTGFAAQILDALAASDITASFGITGRWAEQNPELLRRIVREGHIVMNHSYSHPSFTGRSTGQSPLGRDERWQELDRTEAVVQELTGATTKPYFRAPYGDYDDSVNLDVFARGYRYNVLWTVDSLGWNGLTAEAIEERCLSLAEPGAIYLLHVGSASQDAASLPAIIEGLLGMGYGFATVAELARP